MTISRIKSWKASDKLKAADLNAEFNNIANNITCANVQDCSNTITAFRETKNGSAGATAAPANFQEEIRELRHAIKDCKASTYWYPTPESTTETIESDLVDANTNIAFNVITVSAVNVTNSLTLGENSTINSSTDVLVSNLIVTNLDIAAIQGNPNIQSNITISGTSTGHNVTSEFATATKNGRVRNVSTDGSDPGIGGVCFSNSCGVSTKSTSITNVTNAVVTLTTTGKPVFVGLISAAEKYEFYHEYIQFGGAIEVYTSNANTTVMGNFYIYRDGTCINRQTIGFRTTQNYAISWARLGVFPSTLCCIDNVVAGQHTYYLRTNVFNDTSGDEYSTVDRSKLVAFEL